MNLSRLKLDLFPIQNLIEEFDASRIQRLFVIGDLHGCYDELMNELYTLNFNFNKDLVISVGDLVDRGKDSRKCLELVKEFWFKAIRGNHEQMCLEAELSHEMREFHIKHGGEWLYKLSLKEQKECLNLCLNLPIVLEVKFHDKKIGFVHADINLNNWRHFKEAIQRVDYFIDNSSSVLQSALWGRGRIMQKNKDRYIKKIIGIDEVYLGHTVVEQPVQIQNCFYIDTGVVFGKKLTVIELSHV